MYTRNCEQKATIGVVKLTLKILPQHNGVVPIKITGQTIKEHMAYFLTDEDSTKGRDPNIHIINGIYNIKGKTSVNIWYLITQTIYIKFNKGEYIGCHEPTIEDNMTDDTHTQSQPNTHSTNSVTLQKMVAKQVQPDTFHPPHHKLKPNTESKPEALLKQYASQFAKDETSIGKTPLTEMTTDPGTSDPVSQKPYPIAMTNYQWVKDKVEKLLTANINTQ